MDPEALCFKGTEYAGRLGFARRLGDQAKARKRALTLLIIQRRQARHYHALSADKYTQARTLKHTIKKADAAGVKVPLLEERVKELRAEGKEAHKELTRVGKDMCVILDAWQEAGATFEDLCNLCNKSPDQVKPHLLAGWESEPFSALALVYNLDYKDPRGTGWLENNVDAPLTHAMKAYQLHIMLHTESGRQAAREALHATFPDLVNRMVRLVTDEDGTQYVYDKDGVELGTVEDDKT